MVLVVIGTPVLQFVGGRLDDMHTPAAFGHLWNIHSGWQIGAELAVPIDSPIGEFPGYAIGVQRQMEVNPAWAIRPPVGMSNYV